MYNSFQFDEFFAENSKFYILRTKQEVSSNRFSERFSTGINIKRLHNIVFASPSKSRIRNLQSIGRVLRKGEGKDVATLYDISDDIGGQNYTIKHLNERVNIYNEENFKYEVININLKAA